MGLADAPWQTVLAAAVVGTDRQSFTLPTVTGQLGQILSQLATQPAEAALLTTAAVLSLHQRAGWQPEPGAAPAQTPCDRADLPRCSQRSTRLLQQMLQGQYSQVLPEWLALAAQAGQRVPELELPELLDLGRQQRDLRAAILPVLGQRGRWLAAQNPDWRYAVEVATETDWATGNSAARLLYLQALRLHQPEHARELLQTTWSQEAASDRAKFLEACRPELSLADEPFLETALDDRSKEVRKVAADLLASLPDSRLCQRMRERLKSLVNFKPAVGQPHDFELSLPETCDAAMQRDGIESHPKAAIGERAGWLQQIISATPLAFWAPPEATKITERLKHIQQSEWKEVVLSGWQLAAQRQGNQLWARQLLNDSNNSIYNLLPLLNVLTAAQREEFAMCLIQSQGKEFKQADIWKTLLEIARQGGLWGDELVELVLSRMAQSLPKAKVNWHWEIKELFKLLSLCISPNWLSAATTLQSASEDSPFADAVQQFLVVLQMRQDLKAAFASGEEMQT